MGGLALAAMADPKVYTAPARQAALARFDHEVDPKGVLPPEERSRRAEAAKRFTQLAFQSVKARTPKKKEALPDASPSSRPRDSV